MADLGNKAQSFQSPTDHVGLEPLPT
jgi:thymidylate synthase